MSRVAITVPKVGLTAEEVTVERWGKAVGDEVVAGEAVAELMTDKAVLDLDAPASGRLVAIVVANGEAAAIGAVLGYIDTADG